MTSRLQCHHDFEKWIRVRRVEVDLRRTQCRSSVDPRDYIDLDTEWLWLAYLEGRRNASPDDIL